MAATNSSAAIEFPAGAEAGAGSITCREPRGCWGRGFRRVCPIARTGRTTCTWSRGGTGWTATSRSITRRITCARGCCGRNGCCPPISGFLARNFRTHSSARRQGTLSQVMYFEAGANLIGDMLVKVDRMSMAESLEVRCRCWITNWAELAATIPHEWKIRTGGEEDSARCAGRPAAAGVVESAEEGFGVPLVGLVPGIAARRSCGTTSILRGISGSRHCVAGVPARRCSRSTIPAGATIASGCFRCWC